MTILQCVSLSTKHTPLLSVSLSLSLSRHVFQPAGGVQKGETFVSEKVTGTKAASTTTRQQHIGPVGHWRDGICSCCSHGYCHPHLCLGCFCTQCKKKKMMMMKVDQPWVACVYNVVLTQIYTYAFCCVVYRPFGTNHGPGQSQFVWTASS